MSGLLDEETVAAEGERRRTDVRRLDGSHARSVTDRAPGMNVLFLSLVFPPDGVSTAQLMGELASDMARSGHTVTAITTRPHYNRDHEAERDQPIRWRWLGLVGRSRYQGVDVYHAWMPRKSGRIAARLAAWLWFHLLSTALGMFLRCRPDVIISPSPPLTVGISAWLISRARRSRFIYNVQEIYPDLAIDTGVLRNPLLIRFFQWMERFVYRKAHGVTVISRGMEARLLEKGVPRSKLRMIPNFVDLDEMRPVPKPNGFSEMHGLSEAFVVSYAGNMGPLQGLETLLKAARHLRDVPEIRFLLVGDGSARQTLFEMRARDRLTNVTILEHQPYSVVPEIYGTSDACVVPLVNAIGADSAPSKLYRIMACGRPVVAIAEENSDLARTVYEAGCGAVVTPDEPLRLAELISHAYTNREEWLRTGIRGRDYVQGRYSRRLVSSLYQDLLQEAGAGVADSAPQPVLAEPISADPPLVEPLPR
jgi:colanic acid biosynthesis glycosyl transferase WcaI